MEKVIRMTLPFSANEYDALERDAERNYRDPRRHARYLILKSLGLTPPLGNEIPATADSGAVPTNDSTYD